MNADPVVTLSPQEATEILAALSGFGAMLLNGSIHDDALPDGVLRRLGVAPGTGAARRLHRGIEDLIHAIRRDLDRLV